MKIIVFSIAWLLMLIFPFAFPVWFENIQVIFGIILGIFGQITGTLIYRAWYKPKIIVGKPYSFHGNTGWYHLLPIMNEGNETLTNCSISLYLEKKDKDGKLFMETNLPWSPSKNKHVVDINCGQIMNADVFLIHHGDLLSFPFEGGYKSGFSQLRIRKNNNGKVSEIGSDIQLSKHDGEFFEGYITITSSNLKLSKRTIKLHIEKEGLLIEVEGARDLNKLQDKGL